MIRIAILGCDSSHTEAYTTLMNSPEGPYYGLAKVCWIWGENNYQAEEKAAVLNIEHVLDYPDPEILKSADLIMVIGRFGDSHYMPAIKAIESGKPVFIDKPFTNSNAEANELVQLAKDRSVQLFSFSPLRFGSELIKFRDNNPKDKIQTVIATSPMITRTILDDRVNSIYFYSIHAVDMLLSIIKRTPRTVMAHKHAKGVWADIIFENDQIAVLNLTIDQPETYQVTVFDLDGNISNVNIDPEGPYYHNTLYFLFECLTKNMTEEAPLTEALDSIQILSAIEQSLVEHKQILL